MTQFPELLKLLDANGVAFIVVGGSAAAAHGSSRLTLDLDIVYERTPENLDRIASAFGPFSPYPRGAPKGLPFKWDRRTLEFGLNFTLETSLGLIDLLGEITGGGKYEDLLPHTVRIEVFGVSCLCIDLETLIRVKRAAGRPKDFDALAELESIADERRKLSREE
jgi:predicted nucleotidyltransferase